jgi:hypothetical protein
MLRSESAPFLRRQPASVDVTGESKRPYGCIATALSGIDNSGHETLNDRQIDAELVDE